MDNNYNINDQYNQSPKGQLGYDAQGYDPQGYDVYGYDRQGYDRQGFDRNGYNRYGYDRFGNYFNPYANYQPPYGQPQQPQYSQYDVPQPHLVKAIFGIILCPLLGIMAVVKAAQVNSLIHTNIEEAWKTSESANRWGNAAVIVGVIINAMVLFTGNAAYSLY